MTKTEVNNLSQQLCELCGIEPKEKTYCVGIRFNAGKYKVYPDFEKPENFIYRQLVCRTRK